MTDEQRLIEKLRKIEALFANPGTAGEREAARVASDRVQQRIDELRGRDEEEFKFSLPDAWARALFVALLRRHAIEPYRHYGQRRNTLMARAPRALVVDKLWPEFQELNKTLHAYLNEVTQRVISTAVHGDFSEPEIRPQAQLTAPTRLDIE